ncbi:MAG: germination protein YpeB [Ruminococcus sp.]|nr:germination protein YpeB [Ruminococcus sp.]
MRITKRALIKTFSLMLAAAAVLGAKALMLAGENRDLTLSREYTYQRAIGDLSDEIEGVNQTLEKELYAASADMHRDLSVQLCTKAVSAKAALAQLPSKSTDLETVNKFLSQVGDYSMSLSRKLANGDTLSEKEYANISKLYEFSNGLCEQMQLLRDSALSGETVFEPDDTGKVPDVSDGFGEMTDTLSSYPRLIYDGPFSDNILEKEPMLTQDEPDVTEQEALTKCRMVLGISADDLTGAEEIKGRMPGWRFFDKKNEVSCEVTKQGGFVSYFLKARQPAAAKLSNEEAVSKAEDFLKELGMDSLRTTYYETYANVLTVNFAYQDLRVCCYTDLIKVTVALDNGEILGYDARGYIVNHHRRRYPDTMISLSAAQKRISPKLDVESSQLALIPADDLSERLCYEFKCKAQTGRQVLVYINAETGKEEQILLLIENENSTLTV